MLLRRIVPLSSTLLDFEVCLIFLEAGAASRVCGQQEAGKNPQQAAGDCNTAAACAACCRSTAALAAQAQASAATAFLQLNLATANVAFVRRGGRI